MLQDPSTTLNCRGYLARRFRTCAFFLLFPHTLRILGLTPYLINYISVSPPRLPLPSRSSCTCPGEEHPGPDVTKGRGAPEIDIFEAERNKTDGSVGQIVSQSAQFATSTNDYLYANDSQDAWWIRDPDVTRANTYK